MLQTTMTTTATTDRIQKLPTDRHFLFLSDSCLFTYYPFGLRPFPSGSYIAFLNSKSNTEKYTKNTSDVTAGCSHLLLRQSHINII